MHEMCNAVVLYLLVLENYECGLKVESTPCFGEYLTHD